MRLERLRALHHISVDPVRSRKAFVINPGARVPLLPEQNKKREPHVLSSEADELTRLILARQTLICRAIELDSKSEVLIMAAPAVCSWEAFHAVYAELALIPGLLENLDLEITAARRRLNAVPTADH
jgi:hypothetical protein